MKSSNFKETKLGIFPIDWEFEQVKNLIGEGILESVEDGNHGAKHPKEKDFLDKGIPFIAANDIRGGKLDLVFCKYISEDTSKKLRKGFSISGDVLLTHKGTIGRTAIVPNNIEYIVLTPQVTYYRVSKSNKKLINFYLKYFFDSSLYQSTLKRISKQSTRDYIGINRQKELYILIPSILEQKKIAAILSIVDDLIENTDHLINSYTLLKKGLMQTLLTKGIGHTNFKNTEIGEIPEEWELKKIGEICKSGRGRVISLKEIENKPGKYPVFSSQSKENGCIGYLNTYDFDGEYVTWTTDGVYAGTTFYRNGKFNCTNVCGTLKSSIKGIDMKYLSLALSKCTDKYVVKLGNSKLMNNIMEIIPVPIPNNFEEQKKIGQIIQVIEDIININISKKKSVEVLKKGLMQQLLTGKIRVKV